MLDLVNKLENLLQSTEVPADLRAKVDQLLATRQRRLDAEQRYTPLGHSIPCGLIVVSGDDEVLFVNDHACRLLKTTRSCFSGGRLAQFLPEEERESWTTVLGSSPSVGGLDTHNIDPEPAELRLSYFPVCDCNNVLTEMVILVTEGRAESVIDASPEWLSETARRLGAQAPEPSPLRTQRVSEAMSRLSPKEGEILDSLLQGRSVSEIAERTYRSPHTIRNHIKRILRKLNVHSQKQLFLALRA